MEEGKGVTLRSGKVTSGQTVDGEVEKGNGEVRKDGEKEVVCESIDEKKGEVEDERNKSESEERKEVEKEKSKGKAFVPNDKYVPKLPFPQKQIKARLDAQFEKFVEVLKKLYINIPLVDAVQ